MRLLVAERRYDRRIAPAEAFVLIVVERDLADLNRKRRRGRIPIDPFTIPDDPVDWRDDLLAVDLAFDVATILAVLPEPLREAANQLKLVTKADAARNLRISRNSLNTRVRDLRKAFDRYRIRNS